MTIVTEKDVGKLCWFMDYEEQPPYLWTLGRLDFVFNNYYRYMSSPGIYARSYCCKLLTKEEINKFMEMACE